MDTVRDQKLSGALLWSLRYRTRDGGFYWHHEPAGGDYFKAYHWPGFPIGEVFDEHRLMQSVRERAFEIQGLPVPPLPPPQPPHLLSVTEGGLMTWQGSVGAISYDVQRSQAAGGPWATVGTNVSDAQVQYRPLLVDEALVPGKTYYYRVAACNPAGVSEPSNVVGPVQVTHRTLVDELWNDSRIFMKEGNLRFAQNEARKFKEDCHRLAGQAKSAIIYYAPGGIGAVRVFLFSQSDQPALRILFSQDGRKFTPAESKVVTTATYGGDAYGFWKAQLCSAPAGAQNLSPLPTTNSDYVKIEFLGEAQLSRVEIDHDFAK
jgi:mannan endo-1,4-beta-mannosidase